MVTRIINLLFVGIILAVVMLLVLARQELAQLKTEADALEARIGGATVADPNKYFVKLLKSEHHHIAWRVYLPEMRQMTSQNGMQGNGWTKSGGKNAFKQSSVVRWRVKEIDGRLMKHVSAPFSTGAGSVDELEEFLFDNIVDCEVSIAGEREGEYFRKDEAVTLLSIQASPRLIDRARKSMRSFQVNALSKPYVFRFGIPESMPDLQSKMNE